MSVTEQIYLKKRDRVPDRFTIEFQRSGVLRIRPRKEPMGIAGWFLLTWVFIWTVVCLLSLRTLLAAESSEAREQVSFWLEIGGLWGVELVFGSVAVYMICAKETFRMDDERLIVETDVLGFKRSRMIPRETIRRLRCSIDTLGDDRPALWKLSMETSGKDWLIGFRCHSDSQWLGEMFADWAEVPYLEDSGE